MSTEFVFRDSLLRDLVQSVAGIFRGRHRVHLYLLCGVTSAQVNELRLNDRLVVTALDPEHPIYKRGGRTLVEGQSRVVDDATRHLNHLIWPGVNQSSFEQPM